MESMIINSSISSSSITKHSSSSFPFLSNFGKGGFICSYSCAIGKSIPFGNRTLSMAVSASIKPNVGNGTQTSSFWGGESFFRSLLASMEAVYLNRNPTAKAIVELVHSVDSDHIYYDHLAFRTFGVSGHGIDSLAKIFLDFGYSQQDELKFPAKKLKAFWFSPPSIPLSEGGSGVSGPLPRIFISELLVDQMSSQAQEVIRKYTDISGNGYKHAALASALGSLTWEKPLHSEFQQLARESEYAAWTLVNGYALNHVTISTHHLKSQIRNIESLNLFIEENGFKLNSEGGVLKEMVKGPGLYSDIGKKARDLLYRDYQSDHKFTLTTSTLNGVAITPSATKKGELFLADVSTQLKNKNITTDIKVDTSSNLFTTITIDEPAPGLKTIFSFVVPDQKSGKVELQYLHEYAGISTSIGLTATPTVNFSGVAGNNVVALGTDVALDTATGNFTKYNAGLSFSSADLVTSLALNDKGDTLTASYIHTVIPLTNTTVGAELSHSFSSNENTLTIGTQHALDTLTSVKARVNNYGKVSALIQHAWRPKSLFTISGEVDTRAIEKSAKVGLAVVLKP